MNESTKLSPASLASVLLREWQFDRQRKLEEAAQSAVNRFPFSDDYIAHVREELVAIEHLQACNAPHLVAAAPASSNGRTPDFDSGNPRSIRGAGTILMLFCAVLLGGCAVAPDALFIEQEHVSHPFAGAPFGPENEEDWLDQVNVGAEWRRGGSYAQTSLGYVFTNGGFYGPPLTFTLRVGYRFPLRKAGAP